MKFVQVINNKKFTLIGIFLFTYVFLNLLDGQRGLISYYEKQKTIKHLSEQKEVLLIKLESVEKQNSLATTSSMLGKFRESDRTRSEFLSIISL